MFNGEIRIDFGLGVSVKLGNAAGNGITIDVLFGSLDEGVDIANFGFDLSSISIFFNLVAVVGGSSALEIAEGFSEGVITATENPVDDFALGHGVEVVEAEAILGNHGIQNISDELEAGASGRSVIFFAKRKIASGELGSELGVFKAEFVEAGFVAEDGDVVVETFDVREIPGIKKEVAIAESIFETVSGEAGDIVVGDGEEFVIGDLAGENAILFELAGDGAGVADNFAGAGLDGFLMFGVAIKVVDSMFETGAGDIVEKTSEGLNFIVGEIPDDESNADAVGEDGTEILEVVDGTIIHSGHADVF